MLCALTPSGLYVTSVHRFHVTVAPGTKLESGPATLHLCNGVLAVAKDVPPAVTGQWRLSDLRRYGAVPNGFIFEGGTRCGYWAGVFFLSSSEGERISFLFDCIVRGISPTKGPFGLRPVFPGRPDGNGRKGVPGVLTRDTAETGPVTGPDGFGAGDTSWWPGAWMGAVLGALWLVSVAGDQVWGGAGVHPWPFHGLGCGLTMGSWTSSGPVPPALLTVLSAADPSLGGPATVEERVAQEALEALQLEKRLSLLSHSVRMGSGGDDHSLSSSSSEASHLDVSTSSRLTAWPEPSWSSAGTSQEGPGLGAAQAPGEVALGASRQPPKQLQPRQLREVGRQSSADSGIATGSRSSCSGSFSSGADSSLDVWRSGDEFGSLLSLPLAAGAPEPSLCACPPGTAEYQVPTALRHHYDTPRSLHQAPRDQTPAAQGSPADGGAGDSGGQMAAGCPSSWPGARRQGQEMEAVGSEAAPPSPAPGEPWEAGGPRAEPPPAFFAACPVCGGLKGAAASPPGLPMSLSGTPGPDRLSCKSPTYVNIPVSPSSKKQLHYMGLELQASEGIRGADASRYAQIDIAATEAAHRVGARHAQTREERLPELEQRKKGAPR
ncbi:hypothetical protein MC885_012677 [Smutsia gigantea]|nr:hypothetical protein MC885_012677 [Smutsia gigantea]